MSANTELALASATTVVDLLKRGDVSPTELLDVVLERHQVIDGYVNALPTLCAERAYDCARAITNRPGTERGVLAGLPLPIKDLNPVAGVRTTFGSLVHKDFVPTESDLLVQKLEREDGVVFAKSNTPEFGAGGNTFNEVFGVTRNPFDLDRSSGGSSGGAAAALATGQCWLAQGSDMAGSLRTPASFCGVTSLRPSPGLIPAGPSALPFEVLGQNGPMARDVTDLALFLDAMVGVNPRAALAKHRPGTSFRAAVTRPHRPARVAFSVDLGVTETDPEVTRICTQAMQQIASSGSAVEETHPDLSDAHFAFDVLRSVSFAASLGGDLEQTRNLVKPEVLWNVEQGLNVSGDDIRRAMVAQGTVFQNLAVFLDDYDVLVAPASSQTPMPVEERYIGYLDGLGIPQYYRWLAIAYAVTTATQPVVTLPCGQTADGMPVGLQLIGPAHGEHQLLSVARYFERVLNWQKPALAPQIASLVT